MDPDANLNEQREIAKRISDNDYSTAYAPQPDAERLAELVLALDEWLSKGGFPPKVWHAPHHKE